VTPANRRRLYHRSSGRSPDRGTQEKKKKKKEDPSAWRGPRPRMMALASTTGEDPWSTGQATRGENNEETAARAEKEDETG
jgi:hypothetical protein